jgi:hypothetical protein
MKSKNLVVAGVSLAASLGAIGGGALLSSNAMAASTDSAPATATITMVSLGDGTSKPFSCTISGVTLPKVLTGSGAPGQSIAASGTDSLTQGTPGSAFTFTPGLPVPAAEGGLVVASASATDSGAMDAKLSNGATVFSGNLSITATAAPGAPRPDLSKAVSLDSVPAGTPEQCAAVQKNMPAAGAGVSSLSVNGATATQKP